MDREQTGFSFGAPERRSAGQRVEKIEASTGSRARYRVAGYCRVSTDLPGQATSIENQRRGCEAWIRENPDWEFVGIYWETGVSGTGRDERGALERLLSDCRAGRIDLVIAKSLSRFSRSAVGCLEMLRELSKLGVALRFEKENIQTDRMESELYLTLLAAFAQSESRSISDNVAWGIRRRFQNGTYRVPKVPYGYRKTAVGYCEDPAQAQVVREIFRSLAAGMSANRIAKELNERGVPTWSKLHAGRDTKWQGDTVRAMAKNPFYAGDCLFQKTFVDEEYRQQRNKGQRTQYLKIGDHPALVDREIFEQAGAAIARHRTSRAGTAVTPRRDAFSGKILCGACGCKMYRTGGMPPRLACCRHGQGRCGMPGEREDSLRNAFASALNRLAFGEARLGILKACMRSAQSAPFQKLREELRDIEERGAIARERALVAVNDNGWLREFLYLAGEAREVRRKLRELEEESSVATLRRVVLQRGIRPDFETSDADIFANCVAAAVVFPRQRVEFRFFCGITLYENLKTETPSYDCQMAQERMRWRGRCRQPAGWNTRISAVPVQTEFVLLPLTEENLEDPVKQMRKQLDRIRLRADVQHI